MTLFRLDRCAAGLIAALCFGPAYCARAQDRQVLPTEAKSVSAEITIWIEGLDANRFAERQRASERLLKAGEAAIAALTEVALGDSREASLRAVQILKAHLESNEASMHQQAHASLERISAIGKPAAAANAHRALHPQPGEAAVRALTSTRGDFRAKS